jgi:hypothetical protein
MYVVIVNFPDLAKKMKTYSNVEYGCMIKCDNDLCREKNKIKRGQNMHFDKYAASGIHDSSELNDCRYTWWNFIHLSAYFLLTFIFPSLAMFNLGISTLWEYYEFEYIDAQDMGDISANIAGIMLGYMFSPYHK